jgi:ribonucleoside-diphosphate reductase alpha chain
LLETRELTGEPYLWFIDVANDALPVSQKALGLRNNGSNLCSEISLATNKERTAVCCLSSVNLEKYDEWKDSGLIEKLTKFLDNVLQWFIDYAPDELERAKYSAMRERAIGIGAMGWANFLMKKMIPFVSGGFNSASQWNHIIFKRMHEEGIAASVRLGTERGEAPDMEGTGRRNSHLFAIAPNANSSVLCDTSPSIEPLASNAYPQKSRAGIFLVKNKFLVPVLQSYGMDTPELWKDISDHNGSVQHLKFLSLLEKEVFRTAWEIDQHWVVQHAEDRQPYICQAQSLNVFFAPGTDRAYINSVHLKALKGEKVKSMYYFRTGAAAVADTVKSVQRESLKDWKQDDGECLSCHG